MKPIENYQCQGVLETAFCDKTVLAGFYLSEMVESIAVERFDHFV